MRKVKSYICGSCYETTNIFVESNQIHELGSSNFCVDRQRQGNPLVFKKIKCDFCHLVISDISITNRMFLLYSDSVVESIKLHRRNKSIDILLFK